MLSMNHISEKQVEKKRKIDEVFKQNEIDKIQEKLGSTYYPIRNMPIHNLYTTAKNAYWTTDELDFSNDYSDWNTKLDDNARYFISRILAFFAQSDQIVNTNLSERFTVDIESLPSDMYIYVKFFYEFQIMMENIHTETYEQLLLNLITNEEELDFLKKGVTTIPCITEKTLWAFKWINDTKSSFATRLIAFACLEGIFFSGSFCAIDWLKKRDTSNQNILSGLLKSNEFISRDEGLHRDFAIELYLQLKKRSDYDLDCDDNTIFKIVTEAVSLEIVFITESLPCNMIGMNSTLMIQYIKFVADNLLLNLELDAFYKVDNPFDFMNTRSLVNKTNFFESRPTEYSKYVSGKQEFVNDDDF